MFPMPASLISLNCVEVAFHARKIYFAIRHISRTPTAIYSPVSRGQLVSRK